MTLPRGFAAATALGLGVVWTLYGLSPNAWPGLAGAVVQTFLLLLNLVMTARSRRLKRAYVKAFQRWLMNPLVRALLAVGINPLGLVVLETTGRRSGRPRRTPVGNGRDGDLLWVIAEHGLRAGYVQNIAADARVRVRLRIGWRYRWLSGVAQVLPDDDVLARQRRIVGWHPLRALNALTVRTLGTDLVTVRIDLVTIDDATDVTTDGAAEHPRVALGRATAAAQWPADAVGHR